jgi:hypothetical protein
MTVHRTLIALVTVSLGVAALTAQSNRPAPRFRFERPVVSASGPQRLRPDVALLTGTPRLNDLRLYDVSSREIPYLLVPSTRQPTAWASGRISGIAATEKTSGFEVDFDEISTIDRLRIEGIPPPFMKRANVEASGDRSRWTVLLDQTTIFDLPDSELRQLDLGFAAGAYRYIRVTWDDTNSAKVSLPTMVVSRKVEPRHAPGLPLVAPVTFESRPSEPGKSRYRVRLPGAHLPIVALELAIGGGHVLRRATVTESRLMKGKLVPVVAGTAILRKVVDGALAATALRVPIASSGEPEIDLVIEDGDNPPLELNGISVVFADLPWIYFEGTGGAIVARYGDPGLQTPRYDLEAVRTTINIQHAGEAAWGDRRDIQPNERASTETAVMPTGGAAIDVRPFRYARMLPDGEAGLIAVPLDVAALAHSAGPLNDFADVRVVDGNGRQVPYVLEGRDEPLSVPLVLEQRSAPAYASDAAVSGATSYYRLRLPLAELPAGRLVFATNARVFDRTVKVSVERAADRQHRSGWEQEIAAARWGHANRDTPAPALTLALPSVGVEELVISVAEGDNSPLPLISAQLLLPSYRLRLFRPAGTPLRVVYGQDKVSAPSYDLALLAPQVLGITAREVILSQEQPDAAPEHTSIVAALVSPRAFWGVLIVAVISLLGLLARLLKRPSVAP